MLSDFDVLQIALVDFDFGQQVVQVRHGADRGRSGRRDRP